MRKGLVVAAGILAAVAAWSAEPSAQGKAEYPGYRRVGIALPGSQIAFVKKGDRVDVIAVFDATLKDGKEKVAATILQNVRVADVRPAKTEDQGAVELWVNPNEAQYLALSLHQGELQLSVRAEGDKEMKPMEMASLRKLFR